MVFGMVIDMPEDKDFEAKKQIMYDEFRRHEDEHRKYPLGGMAYDQVIYDVIDAEKIGITVEQLAKDFPHLLGYMVEKNE